MKNLLAAIFAAGVAAAIVLAADPAKAKTEKLPRSHVSAVNPTNMTFAVLLGGSNETTIRYTAKTRFFLNAMPAVSKDLEVGDHVSGTIKRGTNAEPEAVRIKIEKLAPK